jgi:hypothetical protein
VPRDVPVYASAAVVRTADDILVEKIATYARDMDCEAFVDKVIALANKYDAVIVHLDEPVPLEFCECGCKEPLFRTIRREDAERVVASHKTAN